VRNCNVIKSAAGLGFMFEEEVVEESIEEEGAAEEVEEETFGEETEIEGLNISDVEVFLARAEIWDNLLQNKISIAEAKNILSSSGVQQVESVKTSKRSRRKKSS
jgi:hypothetical protein